MAFFQYQGVYNLYYLAPVEAATNNSFGIRRTSSKDLVHWTEKQPSFPPGMKLPGLRGGIIIDLNNTTGYGTSQNPPIVAVLTGTPLKDSAGQAFNKVVALLAFSKNGGDSWAVDTNDISLPKPLTDNPQYISLIWFAPTSKWIMTLAVNDHVEFFSSTDLRSWDFESKLGTEFFPEDVRWNRTNLFLSDDNKTWILLADIKKTGATRSSGGTVYFAGDFNGHEFVNHSAQLHWLDYGEDIYASLLSIAGDGRRINMLWKYKNEQSTTNNKQVAVMTMLPRELALKNVNGEFFLGVSTAREFNSIYTKEVKLQPSKVSYKAGNQELFSGFTIPVEISLKLNTTYIQKGSFPTRVGVSLWNNQGEHLDFGFDRFGFYYLDTMGLKTSTASPLLNSQLKMPFDHTDSTMDLHIILDSSTIECFAEGGKLVMTSSYFSREPFNSVNLFALNGDIEFTGGKIVELDPGKKW